MSEIQFPQRHDYAPISPFKMFVKSNFPFIEATFESLDNYGLYCKVVEYLNQVIKETNDMAIDVVSFTDFTTNYFENLDVQEEINNKLDEMASTGVLQEYLDDLYDQLRTEVNSEISVIRANVTEMMTVAPQVVTSTSAMTNTSKIYILSTNMHIYYWNSAWVDSGVVYGSTSNAMIGFGSALATDTQWSAFSYDFNNLMPNKIYIINPVNDVVANLVHKPAELDTVAKLNGTIVTQNFKSTTFSGACQIYYTRLGKIFWRIGWGQESNPVYGDWYSLDDKIQGLITSNLTTALADMVSGSNTALATDEQWTSISYNLNNLSTNKIYVLNPTNDIVLSNIQNLPNGIDTVAEINGTIFTLGYDSATFTGACQIYYTRQGKVFWRIGWGSYSNPTYGDWFSLENQIKEEISHLDKSRVLSAFKCYGIVGDSLASGECAYGDDSDYHYVDLYDVSWGQCLARMNNNKAINFSRGGLTTRTFFTAEQGYAKMINPDNKCDCYMIGLGVNDATLGTEYIGTSSDIDLSDPTQNEDTFYGNYGKIIQTIKSIQPKAKIFCLTNPVGISGISLSINDAIRDMETIFTDNVYVIDLTVHRDYYISGYIADNKRSGHYNAVAYNDMATKLNEWISDYMKDNYEEFRQIEFIGTNYEWDFGE